MRNTKNANSNKRKYCPFCKGKVSYIDYKNIALLEKFVTMRGKIKPRYYSGVCLRHQKSLAKSIKRARNMALLPFVI